MRVKKKSKKSFVPSANKNSVGTRIVPEKIKKNHTKKLTAPKKASFSLS